ncbi:MAG: TIGR02444 family protein [Pseudomonas sp.]
MQQDLKAFAEALYAQPGVSELCLEAQDRQNLDVCLLLAGLWLEKRGLEALPARAQVLREQSGHWQGTVVSELRRLRRAWRIAAQEHADLAGLRDQLATLELNAERCLLDRFQQKTADWPQGTGAQNWMVLLAPLLPSATLQRLRTAAQALA